MEGGLMIGVDGGGTHTRAVAVRSDGTIAASAIGSGLNYNNIGLSAARENLKLVVDSLLSRCDKAVYRRLVVGLSALDFPADEETRRSFAGEIFDTGALDLESDAYIALMGVTLGGPGAIAICGTGSMLLLLDEDGKQHVSGGWGHALGDVGSSHTLAVEGLRAAINAWEGTGRKTGLCDAALDYYGVSKPRALIGHIYSPVPEPWRMAQFARIVLTLARTDNVARGIVRSNMTRLARQTLAMLSGHDAIDRIGVYGGVFQHHPWVMDFYAGEIKKERPKAEIVLPAYPPEVGAVIHAFINDGTLTEDVLRSLSLGVPSQVQEPLRSAHEAAAVPYGAQANES